MIASLISFLPKIIFALFVSGVTWFVVKLWYTSRYILRSEVKPLQESQHMMQNQYAILAERIKHTENLLAETRSKLDTANTEREQALLQLKENELNHGASLANNDMDSWKAQLLAELKATLADALPSEKTAGNDQINYIRQTLKEFKLELTQKFNVTSNQLGQLIELNKNLIEAEQNSLEISNPNEMADEHKAAERPFTLTSIKKGAKEIQL